MFQWYVINTYSGHENKVKANLEHRIVSMNQAPRFRRVVVPTEQVVETKDGQKVQTEKRVLPGYVLVNMDMSDEAWTVVKGTPGGIERAWNAGRYAVFPATTISRMLCCTSERYEGRTQGVRARCWTRPPSVWRAATMSWFRFARIFFSSPGWSAKYRYSE